MSQAEILHSYRHIYRNLIRGINDASRARKVAIPQLRLAYRDPNGVFDPEASKRTVWFLKAAAKDAGIEHKILKNLIEVRKRRDESRPGWREILGKEKGGKMKPWQKYEGSTYEHYDMTVAMLNKTMGLCLR